MHLIDGLNILTAPLGAFVLVAVHYALSRSMDVTQRNIMFAVTFSATMAIVCELLDDAYTGVPGAFAYVVLYSASFAFFMFQLAVFSAMAVFLDYGIHRDSKRATRLGIVFVIISGLHLAMLLVNFKIPFYFGVSPDNFFIKGNLYFIRVAFVYLPLAVCIVDLAVSRRKIMKHQMLFFIFCFILPSLSGFIDLAIPGSRFLWPTFSLSLLLYYLFIIKADYSIDSLTGVYNRRKCNEFLTTLARASKRRPCTFIMIDMDHFKEINDTFGHLRGDLALKDVANILKEVVRDRDLVVRYGGDEFLLILTNCDNGTSVVDRVHRNIAAFNAEKTRPYSLALSVGCGAYCPTDPRNPKEFLDHVDGLMYQNKSERRKAESPAKHEKIEVGIGEMQSALAYASGGCAEIKLENADRRNR